MQNESTSAEISQSLQCDSLACSGLVSEYAKTAAQSETRPNPP